MAGAHCSVFSLLAPSNNPITRRTPSLIIVSSIPSSRPSKIKLRKNYLRPKILKTLTKPYPPILPLLPEEPPTRPLPPPPILFPQPSEEHDLYVEVPAEGTHGEDIAAAAAGEADKLEELKVSETTGKYGGVSGKVSATTIFKYGGIYLVGAFAFQTICSVWFLGNHNSNQEGGAFEINGREKRNFLINGSGKTMRVTGASNVFYVEGQLEMEKKIEEIKLMAREARRIEEKEKEEQEEDEDPEDGDESAVSSHRLGIEKEIGARLLNLQKRIDSNKDTSAALQINSLGNSVKSAGGVARDDNKNVNQGIEALIFKKKLTHRSPSTKPSKTPKGFPGNRDYRALSDAKKRDSAGRDTAQDYGSDATDHPQILYEDRQVNQQDVEAQESVSRPPLEERGKLVDDESKAIVNNGKNLEEKMETPNMKTEAGVGTKSNKNGHSHAKRFRRRRNKRTL